MNGRPWASEDLEMVRRMWESGADADVIAAAVGRTTSSVKTQIGGHKWRRSDEFKADLYSRLARERAARRG